MRIVAIVVGLGMVAGCLPGGSRTTVCTVPRPPAQPWVGAATRPMSTHEAAITVDLDAPLARKRSLAWCATMQLAWGKLGAQFGGPVALEPMAAPGRDDATALAMTQFPPGWVDGRHVVAEAGVPTRRWVADVRQRVGAQFGPDFATPLLDELDWEWAQPVIAAYTALRVRAPFEHAYPQRKVNFGLESRPDDMENGGSTRSLKFRGFGFRAFAQDDPPLEPALSQVIVHWNTPLERLQDAASMYHGIMPDDPAVLDQIGYVIELKTATPGEHLILARLGRPATLRAAIANAMRRFRHPNTHRVDLEQLGKQISESKNLEPGEGMFKLMAGVHLADRLSPGDDLLVPLLTIDANRTFPALLGRSFRSPERLRPYQLGMVGQSVRFTLDEKGALLDSEAAFNGLFSGGFRTLDFSEPFLVMLVHADAPWPYFAAWVGDETFLVPAPPEEEEEESDMEIQDATTQPIE